MQRTTILVVEDDPVLRLDAAMIFHEAGLDVVEMNSADDALAYTWEQSSHVAAIFTDMQMPGHSDGLHLAETVSRHWPHIFVLVTSGLVQPVDLPKNVTFIPKPWLPLEVLTAVQNAVSV
jgi:CheY-like chemotaxis protein